MTFLNKMMGLMWKRKMEKYGHNPMNKVHINRIKFAFNFLS